ncbi:MAG: GerMN domain-containing protein [Acidobacteriota bacterium]|nr:GerMN domain-containing protein [Acidobacteriota bacterium]
MIPRYQKVLFVLLLAASLTMGGILWHLRVRAHKQMLTGQTTAPTLAPEVAPTVQAMLMVASDTDGTIVAQERALPLPADPGARARALLARLFEVYAMPGAQHPVPGGPSGIAQVFLVPQKSTSSTSTSSEIAVVNLTSNFANSHPSGIQTELLTIQSICSTLHANLPQIKEVRFLVDGQQRETLAGHIDLTRTFLTADTAPPAESASPAEPAQ